jgi:hypothetical protein
MPPIEKKIKIGNGELGPEHFDGDPIEPKITPAREKQIEESHAEIIKGLDLPKNFIQQQEKPKP